MVCRERREGEGRGRDRLGREHRVGSDFPGLEAAHRGEDHGPLLSCLCVGPVGAQLGLSGCCDRLGPSPLLLFPSASKACSVVKRKSGHRRARFRACCPQVPWLAWTVELDSVNKVCVGEAIGQGALIPCDGGAEAPRSPARWRRHTRPVRYSLSNYLPEPADRCSTTRTAIPESIPD